MSGESSGSAPSSEDTTRRRLLTLMGAGGAAALATVVSSKEAQAGHDGSNVLHLRENNGTPAGPTTTTTLVGNGGTGPILDVQNGHGPAAQFSSGVGGVSALQGLCPGGTGVHGFSNTGVGVDGVSDGGTGGAFTSNTGNGVQGDSNTGVGGAFSSDSGAGLICESNSGDALRVNGNASITGQLLAQAPVGTDGFALFVRGKAEFATAGSAVVPGGASSVFVELPMVTELSHISVTLVSDPGSRSVHWIEGDPGNGFTVHMTSAPPNKRPQTSLTYFVVEGGTSI